MSFLFSQRSVKPDLKQPNFFHTIREFDIEKRLAECVKMRSKYPDKVPVIVDRGDNKSPTIDKHKYLVPSNHTLLDFQALLRTKIKIAPNEALFCFIGQEGIMGQTSKTFGEIYDQHKSEDNYLYISYVLENTFG